MALDLSESLQLPISPSLSIVSTLCSTQVPSSTKTILLDFGISIDKADELNHRYNRRSIPIMDDERFFQMLEQIATNNVPDEVESELQHVMEQKSARLSEDHSDAKFEIGMDGLAFFRSSESQQFIFSSCLRKHTIHGFEEFVAYCLPPLIEACQKNKRKRRRPTGTSREHGQRVPSKASKPPSQMMGESNPRRSARISRSIPRRSKHIKGQKARLSFK